MRSQRWILAIPVAAIAAAHDTAYAAGGTPPGNHLGWCRGTGNPHGSSCDSSTTGGTVNSNSGHLPPTTATEVSHPAVIVTGTYGNSFTGYGPVQQVMPQQSPPPLLPGHVQFPGYQGPRDPATGFPVAIGTYAPPVTGYGPVQQIAPQQSPPNVAPTMVQKPVPQPRPAQGSATPADVVVHSGDQRTPLAAQMIPRHAGRQHPNAQPRFEVAGSGEAWTCVASGFQRRRHVDETGAVTVSGVLPNLAMVDGLMRDIPAYHEHRAECLIGVQLRPEHAARGSARPRN